MWGDCGIHIITYKHISSPIVFVALLFSKNRPKYKVKKIWMTWGCPRVICQMPKPSTEFWNLFQIILNSVYFIIAMSYLYTLFSLFLAENNQYYFSHICFGTPMSLMQHHWWGSSKFKYFHFLPSNSDFDKHQYGQNISP